jgi:hypothetical protein
LEYLVDFKEEG